MLPILASIGVSIAARIVTAIASKCFSAITSTHQSESPQSASSQSAPPPFQSVLDQQVAPSAHVTPPTSAKPPLPRSVDFAWLAPASPPLAAAQSAHATHAVSGGAQAP